MSKIALIAGSIYGLLGIIIGAFGAHALKEKIGDQLSSFQTGDRYQLLHALLLLILGILLQKQSSALLNASVWLTIGGILLFSGSIYMLTVFKLKFFGPVTPFGGMMLIVAWALMLIHFIKNYSPDA